ncbi:GIN domain-containing protein [Phenylobacterium aquaticum]|uniref:GIN domain-containing protein n=1 Tax=Phenylobacterium aquaticum TaxID=1763816 RepID=UPI0026EC39F3|nr:DUF2807 domain-containing protein [Phenylobacterium aquaticum]
MIRTLTIVAIVGFVLCIVSIASGFAIMGGPFAIHDWTIRRFGHEFSHNGWHDRRDWHGHGWRVESDSGDDDEIAEGPATTRDFAWPGGALLDVSAPADIVFTQDPTAKLTVTGPKGALDHLLVRDGHIGFDRPMMDIGRLTITLKAPGVSRFDLSGDQQLTIAGYNQDSLDLTISGSADARATGAARSVSVDIAGSGHADLGKVTSEAAKVDISGSGEAIIAPRAKADIDISGDGRVDLLTHPADLQTDITGSGHIGHGDGAPTT